MKKHYFIGVLAMGFFALMACSKPYQPLRISPGGDEFAGIISLLEKSESRSASIIMIHGMCFHEVNWIKKSAKTLATSLKMDVSGQRNVYKEEKGVEVKSFDLTRDQNRLRVYGIVYSSINEDEKREALCYDSKDSRHCCNYKNTPWKRASLNNAIKSGLMNQCLADAMIYLGPGGEKVRKGVSASLDAIYSDIENESNLKNAPIAYYSESLGSKVLRDALICDANGVLVTKHAGTLQRAHNFYMAANQIPMLNLGDGGQTCSSNLKMTSTMSMSQGGMEDLFMLFAPRHKDNLKQKHEFNIVAFSDPNDILSYPLKSQHVGGRKISNVIVSNNLTWFGALENPWGAHTSYLENCEVVDLIAYGTKREQESTCKISEEDEMQ